LLKNAEDVLLDRNIQNPTITITTKDNLLQISDNGGGIKKELQERVFEPYFTTKHNAKGTGLGLFMSKMICEQGFNGALELHSKKNITTFTIKIPYYEK